MTFVANASPIDPTVYTPRPACEIPPRKWLYGNHLISGFVSLTVAPGGLGKSSMLLVEALSMVTGYRFLRDIPIRQLRVWIWNGEDPREEIERRIAAACMFYKITDKMIGDRLMFDSGRDVPIQIVRYAAGTGAIATPDTQRLIAAIQKYHIDVLVVDPFVTSHQAPENDTTAMNTVVAEWRKVADITGCAIELVHHTTKAGAKNPQDADIYASRGAGAVIDGVRSARLLTRMTQEEARSFGLEGSASSYFRVSIGKANLAPRQKAQWCKMEGVALGNGRDNWIEGDTVGVCTPWTPPETSQCFDDKALISVQNALNAQATPPRENERAAEWVGYLVAEALDLEIGAGLAKKERNVQQEFNRQSVRRSIEQWVNKGGLIVKEIHSARDGRFQKCIVAGDPPENRGDDES